MTLDRELVKEACQELWNQCHEEIEELGYTLGKDSMMQAPDGISVVATIQPAYSSEMIKVFKKIIPEELMYKGKNIPVILFPSVRSL